jgi:hypothetical protein
LLIGASVIYFSVSFEPALRERPSIPISVEKSLPFGRFGKQMVLLAMGGRRAIVPALKGRSKHKKAKECLTNF